MAVEVRDNREDPAVWTGWVLGLVGGFLLFLATVMFGLHHFYRASSDATRTPVTLGSFPIPEIQPNPTQDLREFVRRQNQQLAGYAWADKTKGLVHIPIERAMALVVSRGAAALDPPDPGQAGQDVAAGSARWRSARSREFTSVALWSAPMRLRSLLFFLALGAAALPNSAAMASLTRAELDRVGVSAPAGAVVPRQLAFQELDGTRVELGRLLGAPPCPAGSGGLSLSRALRSDPIHRVARSGRDGACSRAGFRSDRRRAEPRGVAPPMRPP